MRLYYVYIYIGKVYLAYGTLTDFDYDYLELKVLIKLIYVSDMQRCTAQFCTVTYEWVLLA